MSNRKFVLASLLITLGLSGKAFAVGWTVDVEDVRVWSTDKAEIFAVNPRDSNPAGSTWDCDYNLVLIGNPVASSMLSTALTAYAANKSIRINVVGAGASCSISYIQTKKQ